MNQAIGRRVRSSQVNQLQKGVRNRESGIGNREQANNSVDLTYLRSTIMT
ncbi:MAG: hypothetical protein F6K52_10275 [Moorea sp. SIO3H5]|nr:hypothetical protein [Moorena sp. SIO3H5]